MKIGVIGLPGSGARMVFEAISRGKPDAVKNGSRVATVSAPDSRIGVLSGMYRPRKISFAQVEYLFPRRPAAAAEPGALEGLWPNVRDCEALCLVARNFRFNGERIDPAAEVAAIEREMVFADFQILEKRFERIDAEARKGRPINEAERALIAAGLELLETDRPLRDAPELASSPLLKGYGLVSAKPLLILVNNRDDDDALPADVPRPSRGDLLVVKGRIESELARMAEAEALEFAAEFGISESALDRVIRRSYSLLGLISFFTVGEDEVKAWSIPAGTAALDAADAIHSDIKRGFIRAEVVAYDDLISAGSHKEAKKLGQVRLEGKDYQVRDGDVICFRFNV